MIKSGDTENGLSSLDKPVKLNKNMTNEMLRSKVFDTVKNSERFKTIINQ
ncbi:hypothetical protein [Clostridium sporogenes]